MWREKPIKQYFNKKKKKNDILDDLFIKYIYIYSYIINFQYKLIDES